jgi:penicillin-binding protein-related factor A (putative recombinase)
MLPPLPKQHKQQEADFSVKFRHWLEANPRISSSFEIKNTRGKNYLNYSEIKPEQINYAQAIQDNNKGVLIRVQGMSGEPDYIYLRNEPALFVIKYPKAFCIINVNNLVHEMKTYKKKSLDFSRAQAIAIVTI